MVQVVLNTQLMAGAPTVTTFRGCAQAAAELSASATMAPAKALQMRILLSSVRPGTLRLHALMLLPTVAARIVSGRRGGYPSPRHQTDGTHAPGIGRTASHLA